MHRKFIASFLPLFVAALRESAETYSPRSMCRISSSLPASESLAMIVPAKGVTNLYECRAKKGSSRRL